MEYTVVITARIIIDSVGALRAMIDEQTPPYILEQCYDINVEVDLGSAVEIPVKHYVPDPELAGGMMEGLCLYCGTGKTRHKHGTLECIA